jgi:hypothetical protein
MAPAPISPASPDQGKVSTIEAAPTLASPVPSASSPIAPNTATQAKVEDALPAVKIEPEKRASGAPNYRNVVARFDPLKVTHGQSRPHLAELSSGALIFVDGAQARVLLPTATEVEKSIFLNQFTNRTTSAEEVPAEKARWEGEWRALLEAFNGK